MTLPPLKLTLPTFERQCLTKRGTERINSKSVTRVKTTQLLVAQKELIRTFRE